MIELNQTFIIGGLIGLAIGFIGHSLLSKTIRLVIIALAAVVVSWSIYSNILR